MKKLRLLLLIFAAALVAQTINAQVERFPFTFPEAMINLYFGYCIGEDIEGDIEYLMTVRTKRSGEVTVHVNSLNGFLKGIDSGCLYKYQDLVARGASEYWPVDLDGNPLYEDHFVGQLKIIKLGSGKVCSMKVHFYFEMVDGELIIKKYVIM